MAKRAFSPGLDAGITKYLDKHHITANDVMGYTIERHHQGGVFLTLRCCVHESFFEDLAPITEPAGGIDQPGEEEEGNG